MLPNYEIQIVPSGMTIYNPPMSDDAFNLAEGGTLFDNDAREICQGAGKLALNKQKFVRLATSLSTTQNSSRGFDFYIDGLESAKTTEGCEWGAKRGRVAEVIRVLKREKKEWEKARTKQGGGVGTIVLSNFNPLATDWESVALQIGDKKISAKEIRDAIKNAMLIQLAYGDNPRIIVAQNIYDGSINGLEENKKSVAWGAKRSRVNAAIRLIKSTIRRPETLVEIEKGKPVKIDTPSSGDLAKDPLKDAEKNVFEKIGEFFGISPEDGGGSGNNGDEKPENKPDYTPLLAGGGVVVAVILIGVLVSAASKGKQGTLPQ